MDFAAGVYLSEAQNPIPSPLTHGIRALIKKKINIYREIQIGAVAKSYLRKGFLIYEEMRKYFPISEEAVSHI
jgi:hypothetical protein